MKKSEGSWTKKRLAVELSLLRSFEKINVKLEQYATPSEIAADWLWNAALKQDIAGKVSADLACGPGVLGCGALLLGAAKVIFVDKSTSALKLAQENVNKLEQEYELGKSEFRLMDVADFDEKVDVVVQNPPFGTQIRHHDKRFLEKAFSVGKVVYSMHKENTAVFVSAMARDHGFKITDKWDYDFRIPMLLPWHRRRAYMVKTMVWRMERNK